MARERRVFDEAFRTNALKQCDAGRTATEVAKDIDVALELLYRWRTERTATSAPGVENPRNVNTSFRC